MRCSISNCTMFDFGIFVSHCKNPPYFFLKSQHFFKFVKAMGPNSPMVDNLNRTCEGKIVIIEYQDDFINGSFLFRKNTKIFFLLYNMYKWEVFITVKASNIFCTLGKSMFFSFLVTKKDVETPKNISCVQEWRRLVHNKRRLNQN